MRMNSTHTRPAFTLVELLTVIAIIGILAGILIPATGIVRRAARTAQSVATFSSYCASITNYRSDYGFFPNLNYSGAAPADNTVINLAAAANRHDNFIMALSFAKADGSALTTAERQGLNRKGIAFYQFTDADFRRRGAPADPYVLTDRHDNPNVRIAWNSGGRIQLPASTDLPAGMTVDVRRDVIVWTLERDGSNYQDCLVWQ